MGKSEREKWEEMKKSLQQEQESDHVEIPVGRDFNAREEWEKIKLAKSPSEEAHIGETPKPKKIVRKIRKKAAADPVENGAVSSTPASKKNKKFLIAIAVIAVVLTAAAVMLSENVKDTLRGLPDGTKLIDESWKNGEIKVIALDEATLWIQITDNRSNQEYEDLGTPWEIDLTFGDEIYWNENYGDNGVHEFYIQLRSLADRALLIDEYEQGKTPTYFTEEHLKNLYIEQRGTIGTGWGAIKEGSIDYMDIEKNGNTYTAVITLPEWFDVSINDDLFRVCVSLHDVDFWVRFCEEGSASVYGVYEFFPQKP